MFPKNRTTRSAGCDVAAVPVASASSDLLRPYRAGSSWGAVPRPALAYARLTWAPARFAKVFVTFFDMFSGRWPSATPRCLLRSVRSVRSFVALPALQRLSPAPEAHLAGREEAWPTLPARQRFSLTPEAHSAGRAVSWATINHQPTTNRFTTSNQPPNTQNATKCYQKTGLFGSIGIGGVATNTEENAKVGAARKRKKLPNATTRALRAS